MPALEYLYTGQLPVGSKDPDIFFGMLQNAHYFLCDQLIQDCLKVLKDQLDFNRPELDAFISHPAFDIKWIHVEAIASPCNKNLYIATKVLCDYLKASNVQHVDDGIQVIIDQYNLMRIGW